MASEIELKQCPWCRLTKDLQILDDTEISRRFGLTLPKRYAVNCPDCGCNGPMADTPDAAAAAWNRRANDE